MRFTRKSNTIVADNASIKSTVSFLDRLPFWRHKQSFSTSSTIELRATPVESPIPKQPKPKPPVASATARREGTVTAGRPLFLETPTASSKSHPSSLPASPPKTLTGSITLQPPPPSSTPTTEADQQSLPPSPSSTARSPTLTSLTSTSSIQSTPSPLTPTSSSSLRLLPSNSSTTTPLYQKQRPDTPSPLVLTLTSKYPTGVAGELYIPVDVSLPPGTKATIKGKMPGLKTKGGFGDLRAFGLGTGVGGSGKEKGVGFEKVPDRRTGTRTETGVKDKSRVLTRMTTRVEGGPFGKRMGTGMEIGTGPPTGAEVQTKASKRDGLGTETKSKSGVESRKESGAGIRTKSLLGAEGRITNGTDVEIGARRNSLIGTGTKTDARTIFGGASAFTAELMKSSGSVLKKRRRSVSSQFYY